MDESMKKILEAQEKALAEFRTAMGSDLDKKISTEIKGQRTEIDASIKTVGDALAKLEADVAKTQKALAAKARGTAGLEDEVADNPINLLRAIPGLAGYKADSRDAEIVREYTAKQRDLSTGSDSEGGVLIGVQMLPGIIPKLREAVKFWKSGMVTTHDGLSGTVVEMPKEVGTANVYWVGENEAPTKSDVTFSQIALTPKRVASHVRVSNRLLSLASLSAQEIVTNSMLKSLGLELDSVILRGSGAEGKPRGIANTPGIVPVAIGDDGGDFTFAVAEAMIVELESNTASQLGTPSFASHPRVFSKMKRERIAQFGGDTGGAYVVLPMSDKNLGDLLGYDFIKSVLFPTTGTKGSGTNLSEVILAIWNQIHVGIWSNIEIKVSNTTGDASGSALLKNQTWILTQAEVDVQVAQPEAIVFCSDAKTV